MWKIIDDSKKHLNIYIHILKQKSLATQNLDGILFIIKIPVLKTDKKLIAQVCLPYRSRQTLIIHLSYAGRPRLSTATSTEDTFTCIAAPADYVISMLPDRDGAVDTLAR